MVITQMHIQIMFHIWILDQTMLLGILELIVHLFQILFRTGLGHFAQINNGGISMRRFILSILTCGLFFLFLGNSVYAVDATDAAVPQDIQQIANDGLKNFFPVLKNERDHYGIDTMDDVNTAVLGKGHALYGVSQATLKDYYVNKNITPNVTKLFSKSYGYVFPVKVGAKPVGIIYVEKINNKWQVAQLSSDLTFDEDFKNTQISINKNSSIQTDPFSERLIYDPSLGFVGIATEGSNDEIIMPMRDNKSLNLKHNQKVSIKDYSDKLLEYHIKNDSNFVGTGGSSNINLHQNNSLNWIFLILIGIVVFVGWKKFAYKN